MTPGAVLTLAPEPAEVRRARDHVSDTLSSALTAGPDADDLLYRSTAVTSELVANAISAGAQAITLEVGYRDGTVRIDVVDDAAGEVTVAEPDPLALSGRGMHIVAAYSLRWGVTDTSDESAGRRKSVWAELGQPGQAGTPTEEGTPMNGAAGAALQITGDLDIASASEWLERADALLAEHPELVDVTVDVSQIGFVDSRGMAMLVRLHAAAVARGGVLVLVGVSPGTARAVHDHGLDTVFRLVPAA